MAGACRLSRRAATTTPPSPGARPGTLDWRCGSGDDERHGSERQDRAPGKAARSNSADAAGLGVSPTRWTDPDMRNLAARHGRVERVGGSAERPHRDRGRGPQVRQQSPEPPLPRVERRAAFAALAQPSSPGSRYAVHERKAHRQARSPTAGGRQRHGGNAGRRGGYSTQWRSLVPVRGDTGRPPHGNRARSCMVAASAPLTRLP